MSIRSSWCAWFAVCASALCVTHGAAEAGEPSAADAPEPRPNWGWSEPVEGVDVETGLASGVLDPNIEERGLGKPTALWAELTGEAPAELVLVLHRVGQSSTFQVFDVRDSDQPRAMTPAHLTDRSGVQPLLSPPIASLGDFDGDGVLELMFAGLEGGQATLRIYRLEGDVLVERVDAKPPGRAFFPFDLDGDGEDEIMAVEPVGIPPGDRRLWDASTTFAFTRIDGETGAPITQEIPPEAWLPRAFGFLVSADFSFAYMSSVAIYARAMRRRGLVPLRPERVFDEALEKMVGDDSFFGFTRGEWYIDVFYWALTKAQRAKLAEIAAGDPSNSRSLYASSALFLSATDDAQVRAAARGAIVSLTTRSHLKHHVIGLLGRLSPPARAALCEEAAARLGEELTPAELSSVLKVVTGDPLRCTTAAAVVLAQADTHGSAVVIAALHAVAKDPLDLAKWPASRRARLLRGLYAQLGHTDWTHRKAAVGALARLPGQRARLERAREREVRPEVLAALDAAISGPQNPKDASRDEERR